MANVTHTVSTPAPNKNRIAIILVLSLFGLLVGFILISHVLNPSVKTRISKGDRLLIPSLANGNAQAKIHRQDGIEAMVRKDFATAIDAFTSARTLEKNDPEILIYLNNARARVAADGNANRLITIAVSVPISTNLNVAQEILRGVAQAQDQKNQSGGIGGILIQVAIADDSNDAHFATQIATAFAADPEILGVVGHNASDASLAAAPIYEDKKLVMISPTSSSNRLTSFGDYIFRTVPGTRFMSDPLAEYTIKTLKSTKIGVCYDAKSIDNVSFKDDFVASVVGQGGSIIDIGCDIAQPNFNPQKAIVDLQQQGATSLLIAPHIDRLNLAIQLAQANQKRLLLLSSSTLYTAQIFQAQAAVEDLVLPVIWHPSSNPKFTQDGITYWNGTVNWRTATAYDASQSLINAIAMNSSPSRESIQSTLRNGSFSATGAGSEIRFLQTGDRAGKPLLVQIKAKGSTYEFVPISPKN